MPILRNLRHERFAQELAKGTEAGEAYVIAGFKANGGNARRLKLDEAVKKRVEAILSKREVIETQSTVRAIEKLAITKEKVLQELARIGFVDVTKAVRWGASVAVADESGEVRVAHSVALVNSDELSPDVTAAIAEIAQTSHGIRIKFHDKRAALVDLGKYMGLFIERHEVGGVGEFSSMSAEDLALRLRKEASELGFDSISELSDAVLAAGNETVN